MPDELKYLVIEDSKKVCEGIAERMEAFKNWRPCGFAHHVDDAKDVISDQKPQLVFIDWSLKGGSAYEVLQHSQNIQGYNPYIIFNTGYQSDNPEIPQEIVNNYKVDKYLVKPFWEKLRLRLAEYLEEAEKKALQQYDHAAIFLTDVNRLKKQVNLANLICVCKDGSDFSKKILFLGKCNEVTLKATWPQIISMLQQYNIEFFITNRKEHLVTKNYIEKYQRPYVFLKGFPRKIEVVKGKLSVFEKWLVEGKI